MEDQGILPDHEVLSVYRAYSRIQQVFHVDFEQAYARVERVSGFPDSNGTVAVHRSFYTMPRSGGF
jgi:hypothetical protein